MRPLRRTLALGTLALGLAAAVPRSADAHTLSWLLSLPFETLLTIRVHVTGAHEPLKPASAARGTGAAHAR